ncbi:hypothetical protein SAMN05428947_11415 [Mucilaginibacter sp. OK283]|jgi:hypothetical protein|nr:hypothetical protein SAMN05428947_11415 [Mucilaginibacter sp. OK283]
MVYNNKYQLMLRLTKVKTTETFVNISEIKVNLFCLIIALLNNIKSEVLSLKS